MHSPSSSELPLLRSSQGCVRARHPQDGCRTQGLSPVTQSHQLTEPGALGGAGSPALVSHTTLSPHTNSSRLEHPGSHCPAPIKCVFYLISHFPLTSTSAWPAASTSFPLLMTLQQPPRLRPSLSRPSSALSVSFGRQAVCITDNPLPPAKPPPRTHLSSHRRLNCSPRTGAEKSHRRDAPAPGIVCFPRGCWTCLPGSGLSTSKEWVHLQSHPA